MSYASSDPEYFGRDPETSSLASTSTLPTTASEQTKKKKKPWSKFKSSIKSIGEKMSSRPKFSDPTESSEQKRVKRGRRGKASGSGEVKSSTLEETLREKSPSKNLIKKLSVETISTPFVGYQPASVSPTKSYAKALHKSGSTSESTLSTSDIDTPKKSLTLDRNAKLAQESPDSGRASQTMGSQEGSRPPSQIKEVASDLSVDSDYTSPRRGVLEEEVLGELVTKTEQFAQSLASPSPKGKEADSEVSVEFIKAESVVKPPQSLASELDDAAKSESNQEKVQAVIETPSKNVEEDKSDISKVEESKVNKEDEADGRKKRGSRKQAEEGSSLSLIDSERSTADPIIPANQETNRHQSKDTEKSDSLEKPVTDPKPEESRDTARGHKKKNNNRNTDDSENKENKPSSESKTEIATSETTDKTLSTASTEESLTNLTTPPTEKENPEPSAPPTVDAEETALSKTQDIADPLADLGPATSQASLSVEEKLQSFLAAEGWSGTIKDAHVKAGYDGSQQPDKRECLYKILVIGELGTGKTSIIKRYVHQFFSQHYRATIGVDFALKVLNWDQNTIIRLQLWDIAGQERFGNMTRVYYKEAVGAFIVFDVTRSATFDAVAKWKQDLDSKVQLADGSHIPCVLLANKCDQQKEGIVNNSSKMDEYCKENNFSAWFETSAKENINIDEAAKFLVAQILQNDKSSQNGRDSARDGGKFPLDGKSEQEGKSCAC